MLDTCEFSQNANICTNICSQNTTLEWPLSNCSPMPLSLKINLSTCVIFYPTWNFYLTLLYSGSLTAPSGRFLLVQSSYKFGHMGTNYDQDPKFFSKCWQCLSYASCDEMIKNRLCKVGLMTSTFTMTQSKI